MWNISKTFGIAGCETKYSPFSMVFWNRLLFIKTNCTISTETSKLAMQNILNEAEAMMQKTVQSLARDLAAVNTGRATPSLLDRVRVDC
jgi:hypothetical protein